MISYVFSGTLASVGLVLALAVAACGEQEPPPASPPSEQAIIALATPTATVTPASTQVVAAPTSTSTVAPLATTTPTPLLTPTPTSTPKPTPRPLGGQVGNQAPPFTLTLVDGKTATLSSLVTPGKLLLLEFFTTW